MFFTLEVDHFVKLDEAEYVREVLLLQFVPVLNDEAKCVHELSLFFMHLDEVRASLCG